MAKYETTQGQWKRVVGPLPGELTTELPEGEDFPVGNVNFAETEAFCYELTERSRRSGVLPEDWELRLPTEAQWECACRAGTTTATSFGDTLSSYQANFRGEPYHGAERGPSLDRATRVGSYPANPWGLHDMHGNSFEWCRDWYHARLPGGLDPDLHDAKSSATRSEHGDISRVRRGGCWADDGWALRSAFRLRFEPARRYDHIGFSCRSRSAMKGPGWSGFGVNTLGMLLAALPFAFAKHTAPRDRQRPAVPVDGHCVHTLRRRRMRLRPVWRFRNRACRSVTVPRDPVNVVAAAGLRRAPRGPAA